MSPAFELTIATYNIHRARGLDRRIRPERIVCVLRELEADIIALQEVWCVPSAGVEADQAAYYARELGLHGRMGINRMWRGAAYGNVTLTRFPILDSENFDLSYRSAERRGCLRLDVDLGGETLHVFNVHLGTSFMERRHQARRLLSDDFLASGGFSGHRVVLGDFNEWTRGLCTRLLSEHMCSPDITEHLRRRRTYPGLFPFMHLDHVYHDRGLELLSLRLHRSRLALVASDHLPLVARFAVHPYAASEPKPAKIEMHPVTQESMSVERGL